VEKCVINRERERESQREILEKKSRGRKKSVEKI
jgi:hypothetical protein